MEKQRICKICNRKFANGKAMGGHMRSHMAKLPIPQEPNPFQMNINGPAAAAAASSAPKSPSSSSSLSCPSTKNHIQSYRSINRELSPVEKSDLAVFDRESETESPRNNPTRRRSKRRAKSVVKVMKSPPEPESVSSVSETFSDEEVAMCLLMLLRDTWTKKEKKEVEREVEEYIEEEYEREDDEDDSFSVIRSRAKTQNKYRCETCNKTFRSYQALGGHRASHKNKKIKIYMKEEEGEEESGFAADISRRLFECPFCDKVFESGQALGGHKKVHFSYLAIPKNSVKSSDNLLDLNLPAPEDDGEVSHVELSTMYNAEMYSSKQVMMHGKGKIKLT